MEEYKIQITVDLIHKLLKGDKIEQILDDKIRFTILPPQDGVFITREELWKIIADKTNMTERLLKVIEQNISSK